MEVPIDDPARRIAVKAAAFEKPTNFVWGQAHLPNPDDVEEMQQPAMPVPQVKERVRVILGSFHSTELTRLEICQPKIKVYEEDVDMSPAEEPLSTPAPIPLLPLPDARANSLQENLGDLGDPMELDTLDEPQLLDIKLEADRTDNPAGASQNREEFGRSHGTEHIAEAEIVRTSTPNFDTSASEGSRFYVKRRVLLGNVSKYLAPDKRDTGLEKYAFKWMIYLQGPSGDEDISPFVRKVRFYLHPDYRPFDVIEVTDPPFRLTRYGWGEIPVRLQIYFADDRNKPVDLIHVLKLDKMKSGRQIPGSERFIDLELDRNTEFAEARQVEIAHKTELVAVGAESEASAKQEVLDRILHKLVKQFPIIHAPGSKSTNVPYSVAPSLSAYWSWVIGKRKAVEWARARLLSEALANTSGVHRSATVPEIVRWCLAHGYTPASMPPTDSMPSAKESAKKVYKEAYCPFCGAYGLHHEQTEECTVRPSMWKNRLWGLTQASDVLKQAGIESSLRLEGDELDLDVDTMFDRDRQLRNRGSYAHSWCNQEHPTAIARDLDFVNEEYERLRLPSPLQIDDDGSQISAGLIFEAARSFVRHLLHVATAAYREDNAMQQPHVADAMELSEAPVAEAAQKMSRPRLLVPYHIYRGISEARDSLDFLTGSGLARGSLSE
ncbi:YEATS domain-containing protein 2 [Geranomyces variabilis]|nr:YEATS domain-containing protein 2 [Geranomyces variabilis]